MAEKWQEKLYCPHCHRTTLVAAESRSDPIFCSVKCCKCQRLLTWKQSKLEYERMRRVGKRNKQRGSTMELELVRFLQALGYPADKQPLSGSLHRRGLQHDVRIGVEDDPEPILIEVKSREHLSVLIRASDDIKLVALREKGKSQWFLIIDVAQLPKIAAKLAAYRKEG